MIIKLKNNINYIKCFLEALVMMTIEDLRKIDEEITKKYDESLVFNKMIGEAYFDFDYRGYVFNCSSEYDQDDYYLVNLVSVPDEDCIFIPSITKSYITPCSSCTGFKKVFNFSDLSSISDFFADSRITYLDMTEFDASRIMKMDRLLFDCRDVIAADFTGMNTSNLKYMSDMFRGCINLERLEIPFNTSKLVEMDRAFCDCKKLKNLDLSTFCDAPIHMDSLFKGCRSDLHVKFNRLDYPLMDQYLRFKIPFEKLRLLIYNIYKYLIDHNKLLSSNYKVAV